MIDDQNVDETNDQTMSDIAEAIPEKQAESEKVKESDNVADFQEFAKKFQKLETEVKETAEKTNEFVDSQRQETANKEIKSAVETIDENANSQPGMAELFLEKQYRDNPDLKKVWDNRGDNPEALEKALGLLKTEWSAMNTNLTDAQVAENQRALQDSQRPGGTVQADDENQTLDKMDNAEFQRHMRRTVQSG